MKTVRWIAKFKKRADEYIKNDGETIAVSNFRLIKIMSRIYLVCLILYLAFVCTFQSVFLQTVLTLVALSLQIFMVAWIWIGLKQKSGNQHLVSIACSIFGVLIMAYATALGIWAFPNEPALAFPLFIICMGQIYTLSIKRATAFVGVFAIIFIGLSFIFKPFDVFINDAISSLIALGISFSSMCAQMYYKITEYEMRQKYKKLSSIDRMTGALNKNEFEAVFEKHISEMKSYSSYALLMLDIDSFKSINDKFGHDFGDKVIVEFYEKLNDELSKLSNPTVIGRFGGDEFLILIKNVSSIEFLENLLDKAFEAVSQNLLESMGIQIKFTGGVAISTQKRENYKDMLQFADSGLLQAKKESKGRYHICYCK